MGRYGRAIYGTAKYGLDLWSQYSVEPMWATTQVDSVFSPTSSFTDLNGNCAYDRVQVSWLPTSQVDQFVLARSNLGFPTSPNDPYSTGLSSNTEVSSGTGGLTQTYTTTVAPPAVGSTVSVTGLHPAEMNVSGVPVTSVDTVNKTFSVASTTTAYGVRNGDGSAGSNANFTRSGFTYSTSNPPPACSGYFIAPTGAHSVGMDDLIAFDSQVKYTVSFDVIQLGTSTTATFYADIMPYDSDKHQITYDNYAFVSGSMTTLAAALNVGDTVIQLTSAANWPVTGGAHDLQVWNYTDSSGKSWGTEYTRNAYLGMWADNAISGNTITLKAPWAGPAIPAGTQVSNALAGNTYPYMVTNTVIPHTWTNYSSSPTPGFMAQPSTTCAYWTSGMPAATAYFKVGWLANYTDSSTASQMAVGAVTVTTQSLTGGQAVAGLDPQPLHALVGDPSGRARQGILDTNVIPGSEYFYSAWSYLKSQDEWILSGRAHVTTNSDHSTLDTFKNALPPYMWNQYSGPGDGTAVLEDADDENDMTRWLQACSWQLDGALTKVDLLRDVWNPQKTPAILLDEAVSMFGLPVEPALGERAQRALLNNAAMITGDRGSIESVSLLVESLTGFSCPPYPPASQSWGNKGGIAIGSNMIANTDESSFEGLTVSPGTLNVIAGTGRWYFTNSTLTRIGGDTSNSSTKIARDPNSDDEWGSGVRYGIRADSVSPTADIYMSLGSRIKVVQYTPGTGYGDIQTSWPHGLEAGDAISLTLDGGATSHAVTVQLVIDNFTVRVTGDAPTTASSPSDGYLYGGMIPVYQGIPVIPSVNYALVGKFMSNNAATAMTNNTDPTTSSLNLTIKYYDQFGNYLSSVTAAPSTAVNAEGSGWSQVDVAGMSPASAVAATLSITLKNSGTAQYLDVDSLMVKAGGTPYNNSDVYSSTTMEYQGNVDYTYEDAHLLTITVDATTSAAAAAADVVGNMPSTIQSDLLAVVNARLTSILAEYLPVGTAFVLNVLTS